MSTHRRFARRSASLDKTALRFAGPVEGLESRTLLSGTYFHRASNIDVPNGAANITQGYEINGRWVGLILDQAHSYEMWASDGTMGGTHLLKDIGTTTVQSFAPNVLGKLGNNLLFAALDPQFGRELWKTDGTTAGTVMVKDLVPGSGSSSPERFAVVNGFAYFTTHQSSGQNGTAIWKTDGTAAGTTRLFTTTAVTEMVALNGKLFFTDNPNGAPAEIRMTDGTGPATTVAKVDAFLPNSQSVSRMRFGLTAYHDKLYFAGRAIGDTGGFEPWYTDANGTTGTQLIDLNPGPDGSEPSSFVVLNDKLLFAASNNVTGSPGAKDGEWFVTDGTPQNTHLVFDIRPGTSGGSSLFQSFTQATVVGDHMFFNADDGSLGLCAWVTDGTTAGTHRIDAVPGVARTTASNFAVLNDRVYFYHRMVNGGELRLFTTDLNGDNPTQTLDLDPASNADRFWSYLTVVGDRLFFVGSVTGTGIQLYQTGGSPFYSTSNGVLTLTGGEGADTFTLGAGANQTLAVTFDGQTVNVPLADFNQIVVHAGTGNDVLNVAGAGLTLHIASDLGATSTSFSVNVSGGATIGFDSTQHLAALTLSGGNAVLSAGGDKLLSAGTLTIGAADSLDLNDNDLRVTNTPKSTIENYVRTAYNFGGWDGAGGIFSSTAKNNPNGNTTLGVLSGQEFNDNNGGTFDGVSINNTDVLVKYTYYGDVDFNGSVDVGDYNLIDFGFSNHLTGWGFGDADYSGGVDVSDYNLIDFAFSTQTGTL